MEQRIQKILSETGAASRRSAEELIRQGKVKINGETAMIGQKADLEKDVIECEGERIYARSERVYIILNKPRNVITSMSDDRGRKTVADLVKNCPVRVYPAGRLDYDSEGLLIMTNDGEMANKIMHPSFGGEKEYNVSVRGTDIEIAAEKLEDEMDIDGYTVRGVRVKILQKTKDSAVLSFILHEGRNRQIRKMCDQVGLSVIKLRRVSQCGIALGGLPSGQWRYLTQKEIEILNIL